MVTNMKINLFKTMWTKLIVQIFFVIGTLAGIVGPIYMVATGQSAWYLMLIPAIFIVLRLISEWTIVLFGIHDNLQKLVNKEEE